MAYLGRFLSPQWRDVFTSEQYDRVLSYGRWDANESDPFRIRFKYKLQLERNRVAESNSKLPFTKDKVPNDLVDLVALSNLREKGFPQFWSDNRKIQKHEQHILDPNGVVDTLDHFCKTYLEEIYITHYVDKENWSVPTDATLMGIMPPHFLHMLIWELKNDQNRKWQKIRNKSSPISKTENARVGLYHMFEYSGTTMRETYLCKYLEHCIERFKIEFLSNVLKLKDPAEHKLWFIWPGTVFTDEASFQDPHFDFHPSMHKNVWIIHIPLQSEGSVISLFDEKKVTHRYVSVTFGTYLALRGDVLHSGFFGKPGNVRFHLVIMRGPLPEPAMLHTPSDPEIYAALREARSAPHRQHLESHPKPLHEEFLEWHERQTVLFVEAWKRVLANCNGGERNHNLSNLDVAATKRIRTNVGAATRTAEATDQNKKKQIRQRGAN